MKGNLLVSLTVIAIALAGLVGWVMNIIAITQSNFSDITGILVLRVIGVFMSPLGAIMGYI
jgi:hypothetical protein